MKEIFQKNINQSFDLKQRFLECILSDQTTDEMDFLIKNLLISDFDYSQRIKIQEYFLENEFNELLFKLYDNAEVKNLYFFEQKEFLNQLLEFGRIKRFYEISSEVGEHLLSSKKYSKLDDFITTYNDLLRDRLNFSTLKLIHSLEEKNSEKVKEIINQELRSFGSGARNFKMLFTLLETTETLAFDDYRVHAIYLKLKHVLSYLGYIKLLKKENVEFGLMASSPDDLLILSGVVIDENAKDILKYIRSKLEIKELDPFYKKLYTNLTKKNKLNIAILNEATETNVEEEKESVKIGLKKFEKNDLIKPPIYKKQEVEDQLISYLDLSDDPPDNELLLTFILSEFYTVAEYYLRQFHESSFLYERVYVFFNLKNYSEVIYLVNSYLNKYEISNPESFLYFKAFSFELLGNNNQALNCFREVNKFNPNYKKVKEILLSYE